MSQINFTVLGEPENQLHHRNAKQFGASDISRSTSKKTALVDVKNILSQRTVHSTKKPLASATKSSIFKKNLFGVFNDKENDISKKQLKKQVEFGVFNDKENDICKKEIKKEVDMSQMVEACTSSHSVLMNEADCPTNVEFVQPVCSFCNKVEDDSADILMKSLTLSKSEINKLALEWERRPVVGIDDMRKIEIPAAIPNEIVSTSDWLEFNYGHSELDTSLLYDIPAVESIFDSVYFEE